MKPGTICKFGILGATLYKFNQFKHCNSNYLTHFGTVSPNTVATVIDEINYAGSKYTFVVYEKYGISFIGFVSSYSIKNIDEL